MKSASESFHQRSRAGQGWSSSFHLPRWPPAQPPADAAQLSRPVPRTGPSRWLCSRTRSRGARARAAAHPKPRVPGKRIPRGGGFTEGAKGSSWFTARCERQSKLMVGEPGRPPAAPSPAICPQAALSRFPPPARWEASRTPCRSRPRPSLRVGTAGDPPGPSAFGRRSPRHVARTCSGSPCRTNGNFGSSLIALKGKAASEALSLEQFLAARWSSRPRVLRESIIRFSGGNPADPKGEPTVPAGAGGLA